MAFETAFKAMVSVLERGVGRGMGAGVNKRHKVAQATAALCVGGMVVARAMEDRAAADELRDACMDVAFELGGWERTKTVKNRRRRVDGSMKASTIRSGKRQ
jgi:TetR/AcrR family transcriptional repressor of nem operon